MPMYHLIKCSSNYTKILSSLWQYSRYELDYDDITDSKSFIFNSKFTINTNKAGIANVGITVLLKYLSNFQRTLKMPLINWKKKKILFQHGLQILFIYEVNTAKSFAITDTKLYVPVVTLSAQDNLRLLKQLKLGFNQTTNWNIYQSKTITET